MKKTGLILILAIAFIMPVKAIGQSVTADSFKSVSDSLQLMFKGRAYVGGKISVQSIELVKKVLYINFTSQLAEYPLYNNDVAKIYSMVEAVTSSDPKIKKVVISCTGVKLENLVAPSQQPSHKLNRDGKKIKHSDPVFVKKDISSPVKIEKGLNNKNIAMWQSHGFYYEQKLLRWEWQRAKLFQTVEDLYTQSYVLPFLVPMLENAGANLYLPRERDVQKYEVIVDNDSPYTGFSAINGKNEWQTAEGTGFAKTKDIYLTGENPFEAGSAIYSETIKEGEAGYVYWRPSVPESGEYAVYVSYKSLPKSSESAIYEISHAGGITKYKVNQKIGGSTWVYLGTFKFMKGAGDTQYVRLSNLTDKKGEFVTADAVKFGGGMGNIARKPSEEGIEQNRKSSSNEPIQKIKIPFNVEAQISGMPRFTEGARYWLQWAGFSDTVYSATKNANDYNDDYMSRGRWVNVLSGGSKVNPTEKGYGIPLDLSFAFHTDAGTTLNDSIIGTLGIYTRNSNGELFFPDGKPRLYSRYLTEFIQSQIVDDVRKEYEPIWQRRGIWDRVYAESRSPKVPAMLLEFLSHQNFADMKYGLDPNFRFTVSRAIYKGMLKYFATTEGFDYVVQPLPVRKFKADVNGDVVSLSWLPTTDSLEPTAQPDAYVVYTRIDSAGFDNGTLVLDNKYSSKIDAGKIYSYKIAAVNKGGISFPSEVLSVYNAPQSKGKVLIVNGFTKVSAPATFESKDTLLAGFNNVVDEGVPYIKDISFIGYQYDFRRKIPWMDDDAPGFGSSYTDYANMVIAGNTFDFPVIHGIAFAKASYSYISCSRESFEDGDMSGSKYDILDMIMGKQLKTSVGRGHTPLKFAVFTDKIKSRISEDASKGVNIIVSGANIGTDLCDNFGIDKEGKEFAKKVLKYEWRTNNASNTGVVKSAPNPYMISGEYSFFRTPNETKYLVEAPDGIEPSGENAWTIFRYSDGNVSAGVAYKGSDYKSVALGFPIEALKAQSQIDNIIKVITDFFQNR